MTDPWRDPTAASVFYADPAAPVFIAPIVLPEPDPVYRDDALFASASANWRPAPVPVPPVPVLDEAGQLILVPPTAAMLRDQAVAALKAPAAHYQAPASRGGARSTYVAEPPERASRRPGPARPPGSVTSSPSTWLPNTSPTPTSAWRPQPGLPTWLPQTPGQPQRPTTASPPPRPGGPGPGPAPGPGPVTYRATGRTPGTPRTRPDGRRRSSSKGWIPGLVVLAFVVLANVVPHLDGILHRGPPAAVDRSVLAYYTSAESGNVTAAASEICTPLRSGWTSGQSSPGSDTQRGITDYKITSTHSDGGNNYTVRVTLRLASGGTTSAVLKVLKEGSGYRVCGGTSP